MVQEDLVVLALEDAEAARHRRTLLVDTRMVDQEVREEVLDREDLRVPRMEVTE